MTTLLYETTPVAVRDDLVAAHEQALQRIAGPGTWLDGVRRVAIAAETRNASGCALCKKRKAALSPYAVDGLHDSLGDLPEAVVEIIHRVVTDPARLRKAWYLEILDHGIADAEYVETIGVVAMVISIDTFARSIGADLAALPAPVAGEPTRIRPDPAKPGPAWVPWIDPGDVTAAEADLYAHGTSNVRRALTLVPDAARAFFDLVYTQYLSGAQMIDLVNDYRAISRAQIELLAARVSAINQCAY